MKSSLARAFFVTALIGASTAFAQISQSAESQNTTETPKPTILVFNYSQASATTIRMAEAEASQILGKAGFPAAWINCPRPSLAKLPACEKEQAPGEIRVRILPGRTKNEFQDSVFGFATAPVFASVYYESALRLAKIDNAEFEAPLILGCVIAHEIGHLLLGPNSHTTVGIMQPRWESKQVRQIMKGTLVFTREQSASIQWQVQKRMEKRAVSALAEAGASPIYLTAQPEPASTVMVRLYSEVQLPPKTSAQAEQEAIRIFRQAGIETVWVECETFMTARDPRCHIAPDATHLVMRIVPKGSSAADSIFGMAFLSETDGRGTYSDVFFGSVKKLHQECGASVGRVLGHVMAHELGHLLLGLKSHATIGIMCPHWYGEQLGAISKGSLFFTPEQATLMRRRLGRILVSTHI